MNVVSILKALKRLEKELQDAGADVNISIEVKVNRPHYQEEYEFAKAENKALRREIEELEDILDEIGLLDRLHRHSQTDIITWRNKLKEV